MDLLAITGSYVKNTPVMKSIRPAKLKRKNTRNRGNLAKSQIDCLKIEKKISCFRNSLTIPVVFGEVGRNTLQTNNVGLLCL